MQGHSALPLDALGRKVEPLEVPHAGLGAVSLAGSLLAAIQLCQCCLLLELAII
jgi:hypothetical protein